NAQMLRKALDSLSDADKARHLADVSLAEIERLSRLVNDLFDVARLQSGKLSVQFDRVQLNDMLARTIEIAQTLSPGRHIDLQTVDAPLVLNGDADRLEQVLLNLLTNAITHSPSTEDITVLVRRVADQAEIQVQDHGPGISESDLPHLFSRFYQSTNGNNKDTYRQGLGLGLYIAREIVTMHGGTIDVSSTSGEGTTFTIRLPLLTENGPLRNA
ncbi:MAG: sensor histidine kinase, partial [Ktedonobacterales bacterium]